MLHRSELANRIQNRIHRRLHADSHCNRRHDIFKVVAAEQLQFVRPNQLCLLSLFLAADDTVLEVIAVVEQLGAREEDHLRLQILPLTEGAEHLVVVVQHEEIIDRLVRADVLLDPDIVLHRMMAVQMIRRDVCDCGDMRVEADDGLELETRRLEHRNRLLRGLQRDFRIGEADVADRKAVPERALHDGAGQRRGRGLAVRAGNGQKLSLRNLEAELNLRPELNLLVGQLPHKRRLEVNAGAHHANLNTGEQCLVQFAEADCEARILRKVFPDFLLRERFIAVIEQHFAARLQDQLCCRDTALAGTCNHNLFIHESLPFHSPSPIQAASDKMTVHIVKTVTTRVSDQPPNSK